MDQHHYLRFRGMFGASLRHVAETPDGRWLALIGWCADAFKVGARDRWTGWAPEQQFRRLRLIANNTRFLILPQARVANLASRALSLSLRRLSDDMQSRYGFTVQPSGVAGGDLCGPVALCGRLLPGVELAGVGGDAGLRAHGGRLGGWVAHGEPQRIWVYPLTGNTRAELQRPDDRQVWGLGQPVGEAPSETRLRSLFGHLREAPEYRSARGIRHSLASVLAVTVVAKLVGYRGVTAIGEFAARLDQKQLRAVRAFLSPTSGRRYPPSRSSLHRILSDPDPEVLERAVQDWVAQTGGLDCALALDGKSAPAHRTHSGRVGLLPGCRRGARRPVSSAAKCPPVASPAARSSPPAN